MYFWAWLCAGLGQKILTRHTRTISKEKRKKKPKKIMQDFFCCVFRFVRSQCKIDRECVWKSVCKHQLSKQSVENVQFTYGIEQSTWKTCTTTKWANGRDGFGLLLFAGHFFLLSLLVFALINCMTHVYIFTWWRLLFIAGRSCFSHTITSSLYSSNIVMVIV